MDTIKAISPVPAPSDRCFWYVSSPPHHDRIDLVMNKPVFLYDDGRKTMSVKLWDYIVYPYTFLSDIHCMAAYNFTVAQMQEWLRVKLKMNEQSKVAFYLYQPVMDKQSTNETKLPGFIR